MRMKETHAEFIEKAKKEYYKIGSIPCTALNGEHVYFNSYGFNHLIRKGRVPRKIDEQIRRINLVHEAVVMISSEISIYTYRETTIEKSIGRFWTLKKSNRNIKIQAVIRQLNNGRKHFFSVM